MDDLPLILALLAASVGFAALHAWRLGNAGRDVAFLGATTGLLGLGSAVTAAL